MFWRRTCSVFYAAASRGRGTISAVRSAAELNSTGARFDQAGL